MRSVRAGVPWRGVACWAVVCRANVVTVSSPLWWSWVSLPFRRGRLGTELSRSSASSDCTDRPRYAAAPQVTGAENRITIENKGRLSSDEVDRMVGEAARFAEEDKARLEKIEARNELETLVYQAVDAATYQITDQARGDQVRNAASRAQDWLSSHPAHGANAPSVKQYQQKVKELEHTLYRQ